MLSYLETNLIVNISLTLPPVVSPGLGYLGYAAIEDAAPISGVVSVSTPAEVADMETAGTLSAQAAQDLIAALSQPLRPSAVYVASYDPTAVPAETVGAALDKLRDSGVDIGVLAIESRTNTDNDTFGDWLAQYPWAYLGVAQSGEAGLLTAGKPSALESLEQYWVSLGYNTDAASQAAGYAGALSAARLADRPLGAKGLLWGVPLPAITQTQALAAEANDVAILRAVGAGASASQRIIGQVNSYGSGSAVKAPLKAVTTVMYAARQIRAQVEAMVLAYAARYEAIDTGLSGQAALQLAITMALDPMAQVGHFEPAVVENIPFPEGYRVEVRANGSELVADVVVIIAGEATRFVVNINGHVV